MRICGLDRPIQVGDHGLELCEGGLRGPAIRCECGVGEVTLALADLGSWEVVSNALVGLLLDDIATSNCILQTCLGLALRDSLLEDDA